MGISENSTVSHFPKTELLKADTIIWFEALDQSINKPESINSYSAHWANGKSHDIYLVSCLTKLFSNVKMHVSERDKKSSFFSVFHKETLCLLYALPSIACYKYSL